MTTTHTESSQVKPRLTIELAPYLASLRVGEQRRPESERRVVPTLKDLAADIGLSAVAVSNIANNKINQLDLGTGYALIAALRRRGFDTQVGDLLAFRED